MSVKKDLSPEYIFDLGILPEDNPQLLKKIIDYLRPKKKDNFNEVNNRLHSFISFLEDNEKERLTLKKYLGSLVADLKFRNVLTEADMLLETVFWGELFDRLVLKLLPQAHEENTLEHEFREAGIKNSDLKWILNIDNILLEKLISLISEHSLFELPSDSNFIHEILLSVKILNYRLGGHAFDTDVLKLVPKYSKPDNPFIGLQNEMNSYIKSVSDNSITRKEDELQYKQVLLMISQCELYLSSAYNNISTIGISFKAHQKLLLIERILQRLKKVFDYMIISNETSSVAKISIILKDTVSFFTGNNKIGNFIDRSTQNIAKEITGNIGEKGESYITITKSEYLKMFYSALGGGFLVAFACFIKMNLGYISTSLFGKALMYSLNYIWVFTSIYLLNFTLATKQPAMTASTLAKAIKNDLNEDGDYSNLVLLFSRLWRSQFVAFAGNVIMVIPIALLIMYVWTILFNTNPATAKAPTLLNDLNFIYSPLILHSAIAGVFLFISGLISGYTVNRTKFNQFSLRIKNHPVIANFLSENKRERLADYLDRNIGGIVSNFWFGIFMGSTVIVGIFIGLNLDIRHITFAAGNFALALFGQNFNTSWYDIYMSLAGIFIIGFINFTVSFTLSLFLALRSRGVSIIAISSIVKEIWSFFLKNPVLFFYPAEKNK
jgi:site-specific recombinase